MKTCRVAIVGLGRMASTIDDEGHDNRGYSVPVDGKISIAASCQASEHLELVAGADILPEKRQAFGERWGITALYENYMEMMDKEKPDMVAVLTNGPLHAGMGTAVANAGVPMLYLEKVMGGSVREADAVLEACRKHGTVFNTGVLRRFDNRFEALRDLIARGDIGEPEAALFYQRSPLLHNHIHVIDTISYLLGDPEIVAVRGELEPRGLKIEGNRMEQDPDATFEILFDGGVRAWSVPAGSHDYEIIGSEGSIRTQNNGAQVVQRKAGPSPGIHKGSGETIPGAWENVTPPRVELKSAVLAILEDLVDAYESGRPALSNVELTHHITEACFAVAESHRNGGVWMELPLKERDLYIVHR